MLQKMLWALGCYLPLFGMAQGNNSIGKGVQFEQVFSWQEARAKAKAENKYIFLDCYATWCGPCKKMDKDVYPTDSVGEWMNGRFVSVKVQMDTSKQDNAQIQSWYADAHEIMRAYKVSAYPTFLFFSPEGKIVHKGLGYQQVSGFIDLAIKATDPAKQYCTLVNAYLSGTKDYTVMPYLAKSAKALKEPDLASTIAAEYLRNYLNKLPLESICTKDHLDFIGSFAKVLTSNDKVFDCLYHHSALADSAEHDKDFADRLVNYIANKEEITPALAAAKKDSAQPDWDGISRNVKHKFGGKYVEKNVIVAKLGWYKTGKDWKNYAKYVVRYMGLQDYRKIQNDFGGRLKLNNAAWEVFQYSNRKDELKKALTWSERVIEMDKETDGNELDTKANLLYKLGRKEDALLVESKAFSLAPKDKVVSENFQKMQHGEPTWVTQ